MMIDVIVSRKNVLLHVLSEMVGYKLNDVEFDELLANDRIWEILGTPAFLRFYIEWDEQSAKEMLPPAAKGSNRHGKHISPQGRLSMPDKLKKIDDEIKKLMAAPPSKERSDGIRDLEKKKKHVRNKGEDTGEHHGQRQKNNPGAGAREIEELEGEGDE